MVLASARLRGIHPPDNIQNGARPGGDASQTRTGQDHGVSILMMNHGVAAVTRVDLLCALFGAQVSSLPFFNFPLADLLQRMFTYYNCLNGSQYLHSYTYYCNKRKLQKLLFISLEMDHTEIGR